MRERWRRERERECKRNKSAFVKSFKEKKMKRASFRREKKEEERKQQRKRE